LEDGSPSRVAVVAFWHGTEWAVSTERAVLAVLASEPDAMHTSAAIAETLKESAVMVRRTFLLLHKAGLIVQRKGPHGGAKLKLPAKQIGLGDVFEATAGDWLHLDDKAVNGWMRRCGGMRLRR